MSNPFAGLRNKDVYETGQYLQPGGRYKLEIEKCIYKKTRSSGDGFIVECRVLESPNEKDPVGAKRSWFQSMKDLDVALPAIKAFVYAALGYEFPRDKEFLKEKVDPGIDDFVFTAVVGERQVFKGRKIGCETTSKVTQKNKKDFTRHDFYPADTKMGG